MPEIGKETLWCCHIVGPDDVVACEDFEAAVDLARKINARFGHTPATENDARIRAEVILWPWSAEQHAADLVENAEHWKG